MLYHHHQITLTEANRQLTQLCEQVIENREIVIIKPTEGEKVALIPLEELYGLLEAAHLLRSPNNATRLFTALQRAKNRTLTPQKVEILHDEFGLNPDNEIT